MMGEALSKWLAHYDPIHRGYTVRGIANGVCATNGFAFPRIAGGYNLYRGSDLADVDFAGPVGAAGARATRIVTFPWRPAGPSTTGVFVLRAIGGGGVESAAGGGSVRVDFDESGVPGALRPNAPANLVVSPAAGGRFTISWTYLEKGQEVAPVAFRVFSDAGSGTINFATPIGEVPYRARTRFFEFRTEAHGHGAERVFAVRAVAGSGADDGNVLTVRGWADAEGPHAPGAVFVDVIETE